MATGKKRGRPTNYNAEIAEELCKRIAHGDSLREICKADDMPGRKTVFVWLSKHEEFAHQYARARTLQTEHWAHEILEIADESEYDAIEEDGKMKWNHEHINRARLRVDTRKWLMSKLAPKKYGERQALQHEGPDGGQAGLTVNILGTQLKPTSETD